MTDIYPRPEDGWVCFHCGERFTTYGGARDHFGADPSKDPACRIKIGEERGLVMALRKAEDEIDDLRRRLGSAQGELESAEHRVSSLILDIHSYKAFKGCNSIRDVFNLYDSMEGRALAAEERLALQNLEA